jgi:Ca-activated chloride channel family protein
MKRLQLTGGTMKVWRAVLVIAAVFLCAFFYPHTARAEGIILPQPDPCPLEANGCPAVPAEIRTIQLRSETVQVSLTQQLAVTQVTQVFFNPNDQAIEASYYFPLPTGAALSSSALWVDGQPAEAQVLDVDSARAAYQNLVQTTRDPGLLTHTGQGALRVQLFPLPALSEKTITLTYTQVLDSQQGLTRYTYPLRHSGTPIELFSFQAQIQSSSPLRAVYSPNRELSLTHPSDTAIEAAWQAASLVNADDFELFFSSGESQAAHLLTYRDSSDAQDADGTFILMLAPQAGVSAPEAAAKDLLLVVDQSASMDGAKWRQAQSAIQDILGKLNPQDRFYLSTFGDAVNAYAPELTPATQAQQAANWLDSVRVRGGTNLGQALLTAAQAADPARPSYLILITDGLPTSGETDRAAILADFSRMRSASLRVFSIGIGDELDTTLLDTLSTQNHGRSLYIRPDQSITAPLQDLYKSISAPVLTDVSIDFGGALVYDLYPQTAPDLFAGQTSLIMGRYRQPGNYTLTVSGNLDGESLSFTYENMNFSAADQSSPGALSELPRLWAARKIGTLLTSLRVNHPDAGIIAEINALSLRYGILTPFSAYLLQAPLQLDQTRLDQYNQQLFTGMLNNTGGLGGQATSQQAANQDALANVLSLNTLSPGQSEAKLLYAGDAVFVLQDDFWTDTRYQAGTTPLETVTYLSPRYFQLAQQSRQLAAAFALNQKILAVADGRAYQILPALPSRAAEYHPTGQP